MTPFCAEIEHRKRSTQGLQRAGATPRSGSGPARFQRAAVGVAPACFWFFARASGGKERRPFFRGRSGEPVATQSVMGSRIKLTDQIERTRVRRYEGVKVPLTCLTTCLTLFKTLTSCFPRMTTRRKRRGRRLEECQTGGQSPP